MRFISGINNLIGVFIFSTLATSCTNKDSRHIDRVQNQISEESIFAVFEFKSEIDSNDFVDRRFLQLVKSTSSDTLMFSYYTDSLYLGRDSLMLSTSKGDLEENCLVIKVYDNKKILHSEEFQRSLDRLETQIEYHLLDSSIITLEDEVFRIYHYTTSHGNGNQQKVNEDLYFSMDFGWIATTSNYKPTLYVTLSESSMVAKEKLNGLIERIMESNNGSIPKVGD